MSNVVLHAAHFHRNVPFAIDGFITRNVTETNLQKFNKDIMIYVCSQLQDGHIGFEFAIAMVVGFKSCSDLSRALPNNPANKPSTKPIAAVSGVLLIQKKPIAANPIPPNVRQKKKCLVCLDSLAIILILSRIT